MSDALDDAAAAALWSLRKAADENMGALYHSGGTYGRTDTVNGNGQHVKGSLSIPTGSLVALFHNHPRTGKRDAYGEKFSADDKAQARRLGVPSYITTDDGTVRSFDPRTGKTEEVLAAFPWEEFRAHMMRTLLNRAPDDPRGLKR